MAEFKRFHAYHRILHVVMAVSFIGLVASGMPIKYAQAPWAGGLTRLLGGYEGAAFIHRICAVIFGTVFIPFLRRSRTSACGGICWINGSRAL